MSVHQKAGTAVRSRTGSGLEGMAGSALLLSWPFFLTLPQMAFGSASRAVFIPFVILATLFLAVSTPRTFKGKEAPASQLFIMLTALIFLVFLMTAISVLRASSDILEGTQKLGLAATVLSIGPFWYFGLSVFDNPKLLEQRFRAFLLSLPVFLAVNLTIFAVLGQRSILTGVTLVQGNFCETLGLFGIHVARLSTLPGLIGANAIGISAGFSVFSCYFLLWLEIKGKRNFLTMSGIGTLMTASLMCLAWADSRGVIIYLFVVIAAMHTLDLRKSAVLTKIVLVFSLFSSMILSQLFGILSSTPLGDILTRSTASAGGLGVGTGRPEIWAAGLDNLSHPAVKQIFGYGFLGQYNAGISLRFLSIFKGYDDYPHLHNGALQSIFDIGYLGELIFVVTIWSCISAIQKTKFINKYYARFLVIFILFVAICNCTEVVATIYQGMSFFLFLGILIFCVTISRFQGVAFDRPRMHAVRNISTRRAAIKRLTHG